MENKTTLTLAAKEQRNNLNPIQRAYRAVSKRVQKFAAFVTTMFSMAIATGISAFAEDGAAVDGEAAFNQVIGFFATWIGRIGLVVAFVGGVMFALAIKADDAEAKTRGLMTLASGFVVFEITLSLDLFGITG